MKLTRFSVPRSKLNKTRIFEAYSTQDSSGAHLFCALLDHNTRCKRLKYSHRLSWPLLAAYRIRSLTGQSISDCDAGRILRLSHSIGYAKTSRALSNCDTD